MKSRYAYREWMTGAGLQVYSPGRHIRIEPMALQMISVHYDKWMRLIRRKCMPRVIRNYTFRVLALLGIFVGMIVLFAVMATWVASQAVALAGGYIAIQCSFLFIGWLNVMDYWSTDYLLIYKRLQWKRKKSKLK